MNYSELQSYWMVNCEGYLTDVVGMEWDDAVDLLANVYSDHSAGIDGNGLFTDYIPIADAMYEACCEASGVFCPDNLLNPYEFLSELNRYG